MVNSHKWCGVRDAQYTRGPDKEKGFDQLLLKDELRKLEGCGHTQRCWPCLFAKGKPYDSWKMCPHLNEPGHEKAGYMHRFKSTTKDFVRKHCVDAGCEHIPGWSDARDDDEEAQEGKKHRGAGRGRGGGRGAGGGRGRGRRGNKRKITWGDKGSPKAPKP